MKLDRLQQFLKECSDKGVEVPKEMQVIVEDFEQHAREHAHLPGCELNTMEGQRIQILKPFIQAPEAADSGAIAKKILGRLQKNYDFPDRDTPLQGEVIQMIKTAIESNGK